MAEAESNDDDEDVVEKAVTEELDGIANAATGMGSGLEDEDLGLSWDLLCRHSAGPPTDGDEGDVGESLRMIVALIWKSAISCMYATEIFKKAFPRLRDPASGRGSEIPQPK